MSSILSEANKNRWGGKNQDWLGYLIDKENKIVFFDRIKVILNFLKKYKKGDIDIFVDIGGADGVMTKEYAKILNAKKLVCLDINAKNEFKNNTQFINYDLNKREQKSEIKDNSSDFVMAASIIEHIIDPDFLLEEIYRILKPQGISIVVCPRFDCFMYISFLLLGYQPTAIECSIRRRYGELIKSKPSGHIQYFTKRAIEEMIRFNGFKIIDSTQVSQIDEWYCYSKKKTDNFIKKIFNFFVYIFLKYFPFRKDVLIYVIQK